MLWQRIIAQSAFTMRDLLNVARAEDPHARLERIYEWYFARTMTAIRVSYGAAAAASAAIYGLVEDKLQDSELLSYGLAVAAAVCVVASVVQRRELAQLHSEFAAALGLLSDLTPHAEQLRTAPGGQAGQRITRRPTEGGMFGVVAAATLGIVIVIAAAVGIGIFIAKVAGAPTRALAVVAGLVVLLGAANIAAEIWPARARVGTSQPEKQKNTLEDVIGDIRLDEYVLARRVKTDVDAAIKMWLKGR